MEPTGEAENCESLQGAADLDLESHCLDVLMQAEERVGVSPAYGGQAAFFSLLSLFHGRHVTTLQAAPS